MKNKQAFGNLIAMRRRKGVLGSPLAATYDLMLEFSRAVSLADVYRVLLSRAAPFGVESVLAGIVPKTIVRPDEQPGYVILGHWPVDWADRYFRKQYVRRDPTILHCLREDGHLLWSDIDYRARPPEARRIMEEASEFRLIDGITIPQLTLDDVRIGVSFSGQRLDRSQEAITVLTVLAAYSVARALQLRATADVNTVGLTQRERECLLWLSEGKTADDTATILSVSSKTVEKHLATAREKLRALTGAQAVANALRHGLL